MAINDRIIISNEGITPSFDKGIEINDQTITIKELKEVEIVYQNLDEDINISIIVNSHNRVDIIEKYNNLNNITINKEMIIRDNAIVYRYVQNNLDDGDFKLYETVNVYRDCQVKTAYVEFGKSKIKADIFYNLIGEGCDVRTRLAALSDQVKKYYKISILHNAKHTYGNMDNYGVVRNKGSLIIDGIGSISKSMSKSSTHQANKIIVYDKGCVAKANPYLYINEYDVKASHGASVGSINPEHLYYLESRGISKRDAMELVTYGYFLPITDFINNDTIQIEFEETLRKRVVI